MAALPPSAAQPAPAHPRPPHGALAVIGWIGALWMVLAAAGLGSVLFLAPYAQVQALGHFTYHDEGFYQLRLASSPARYAWLRAGLAGCLAVGTGLLLGLRRQGIVAALRAEMQLAGARVAGRWRQLPRQWQCTAAALVGLLVVVRAWYGYYYPLGTDEIASYDYFVREGPLAIISYYPIPNNHIFYNLLAAPLAALGLPCRLVMRLPTLLLGTLGTVVGYGLLARLAGLRLATLLTGLVGLAPLWVYYGAVGRGYFVQFGLLQAGFFAVLELLRPHSRYWRLSWLGLIGTSILGLYTIPTYAYPLASLLLGGGVGLLAQRRWRRWGELVVAGLVIMAIAALLYAPVIAVSGWKALVANRYVVARTAAQFWPAFRAVLYETGAELFGPSLRLSGPAWLAGALLGGLAVGRWVPAGPRRRLGLLAWGMLLMPIVLMAAQRVYAPVRTILYVSWFGYLLVALLLRQLVGGRLGPARWLGPLLLAGVLGIGGVRLLRHQEQVQASRRETAQLEQAYHWLRRQAARPGPPARVWLHAPLHELFFAHYALEEDKQALRLVSGGAQGPTRRYDFLLLDNYFTRTEQKISQTYRPAYHDSLITIFVPTP